MSLKYAEIRIKEALELAGGNVIRARQQVMTWAFEDQKLLYALTKNHMNGIVAYHVDRVASGRAEKAPSATAQEQELQEELKEQQSSEPVAEPAAAPKTQKTAQSQKVKPEEGFGMDLLKAVANSSSEVFGLEDLGRPQKRGQASQHHVDVLRAMASKSPKPTKKSE